MRCVHKKLEDNILSYRVLDHNNLDVGEVSINYNWPAPYWIFTPNKYVTFSLLSINELGLLIERLIRGDME